MRIRQRVSASRALPISPVLAARIVLGAFGAWVASIGIRALLRGHPFAANAPVGRWLVGGVLAHDAVIAPSVFVLGALSARLTGPRTRQALAAVLLIGGSVLIVGLPDVLRKGHNANATVTPLDYTRNLIMVLLAVAGGVALTTAAIAVRQRRHERQERREPAPRLQKASIPADETPEPAATGFFLVRSLPDRWTLVSPRGERFVNIGIRDGLVRDPAAWGFTAICGTEERVSGTALVPPDYAIADMPYCVPLRPLEIESSNGHPAYRDPTSAAFDEYCDYLARAACLPHADDPNLIGYFLVDGPCWDGHPTGADFPSLRGLDPASRAAALGDLAAAYYATVTRHIRAHDPNHLILGDRCGVHAGMPEPVLLAMREHVDVLSVQTFTDTDRQKPAEVVALLDRCHDLTGKPILIAGTADWCATAMNPRRASDLPDQASRAEHYIQTLTELIERPWCLGWNWCGYIEAATSNSAARGVDVKDPYDEPCQEFIEPVSRFNHRVRAELRHGEPVEE